MKAGVKALVIGMPGGNGAKIRHADPLAIDDLAAEILNDPTFQGFLESKGILIPKV